VPSLGYFWVCATDYNYGCFGSPVRYLKFRLCLRVLNHYEMPWLTVSAGGCQSGCFKYLVKHLVGNRIGLITSYAPPLLYHIHKIHFSSPPILCYSGRDSIKAFAGIASALCSIDDILRTHAAIATRQRLRSTRRG